MTEQRPSKELTPTLEQLHKYAYAINLWPRNKGVPVQMLDVLRKQVLAAWSLRAENEPPAVPLTFEEEREEYARVRGLSDEAIVRECIESPLRVVRELANRYDVVCEKLEKASEPPADVQGPCPNCGAKWASVELSSSEPTAQQSIPTPYGYPLWKHLHDEHGLTLTESELNEIARLSHQPPPDALKAISDARLEWGMLCECTCSACTTLDQAIRNALTKSERCEHGVWKGDHCWACQPVRPDETSGNHQ